MIQKQNYQQFTNKTEIIVTCQHFADSRSDVIHQSKKETPVNAHICLTGTCTIVEISS